MSNNLKQPINSPRLEQAFIKKGMRGVKGTVIEALPNTNFRIKLETGEEIMSMLSGKMRQAYIRVSMGDKVVVELSPNEKITKDTKGRIVFRER